MNIPEFQQNIGETAECIKGINNSGKGCGQLSSNDTLFSDSLFRGVKKLEEKNAEGVYYCGPANTSQKGYCLYTLERLLKEWTGGSHLVMKSTSRVTGDRPLMYIVLK